MGCDIHMYPERAVVRDSDNSVFWTALAKDVNPGRDYGLFAKIAGVRGPAHKAMFGDPRGVPANASLTTKWDNQLYVTDDPDLANDPEWVLRERAEGWVKSNVSKWVDDAQKAVTHPDHHSHTWLTAAEFRQALEAPQGWPVGIEYWALLAMVEEIERQGERARLIMWFDN